MILPFSVAQQPQQPHVNALGDPSRYSYIDPRSPYADLNAVAARTRPLVHLLRPEFSRRDTRLYEIELHLDRAQATIVRLLIDLYLEEFDAAALPLLEALPRTRIGHRFAREAGVNGEFLPDPIVIFIPAQPAPTPSTRSSGSDTESLRTIRIMSTVVVQAEGAPVTLELQNADATAIRQVLRDRINADHTLAKEVDPAAAAELAALARAFRETRDALASTLRRDVELILSDRQLEAAARAHRLQRLDAALPLGTFAGESLNLRALLRSHDGFIADNDGLAAMLDPWCTELDALLMQRTNQYIDLELVELDLAVPGKSGADHEASSARRVHRHAESLAQTKSLIASATELALEELHQFLDDDTVHDLFIRGRQQCFPSIYLRSQVLKLHDDALQLDVTDLTEAIAAQRRAYAHTLIGFNEALVAVYRDQELERFLTPSARRVARANAAALPAPRPSAAERGPSLRAIISAEEQPILERLAAHGALENRLTRQRTSAALQAVAALRALIGPEQFALLPTAPAFDPFHEELKQLFE